MSNGLIRVTIDRRGLIQSLDGPDRRSGGHRARVRWGTSSSCTPTSRTTGTPGTSTPTIATDRLDLGEADESVVVVDRPDEAAIRVTADLRIVHRRPSTSGLRAGQRRLDIDTEIDWHETEQLLKLAFPFDVHADRSIAEIQFGHVARPTHTNTSWEAAKFEFVAHRWLFVGEPGYGVAVVNDATYGHDVVRTTRGDGGTTTTVRLSLLRAPRFPDPLTDQGAHRFRCAVVVGTDIAGAIREGYRINLPERQVQGQGMVAPLVSVADPAAIVEAVKLADDRSGDVIVRIYEAHGGRVRTPLTTSFPLSSVEPNDLLERPIPDVDPFVLDGQTIDLRLGPFEIATLRLRPARQPGRTPEGRPG